MFSEYVGHPHHIFIVKTRREKELFMLQSRTIFIPIFVSYFHATERIPSFSILICAFRIFTIQTRIPLHIIMRLIKIPVRIYYQVDLTTVSNYFKARLDSNIHNVGT